MKVKIAEENQEVLYETFKKMISAYGLENKSFRCSSTERIFDDAAKVYQLSLHKGDEEYQDAFKMDLINDPIEGKILVVRSKATINTPRRIKDMQALVETFNWNMASFGLPAMDPERINVEGIDENIDLSATSGRKR